MPDEPVKPTPSAPAFPCESTELRTQSFFVGDSRPGAAPPQEYVQTTDAKVKHAGLTKREYAAIHLMAAMCAQSMTSAGPPPDVIRQRYAAHAVAQADALLEALK